VGVSDVAILTLHSISRLNYIVAHCNLHEPH
jgi:hypothetical protein